MSRKIFRNTKEMTQDEWLESRRRGIGGSDAGTIMGLNPYKTPYELWEEKINGKEYSYSEATYWGNTLEEVVAKEFCKRADKKVANVNFMLQHEEYDFMLANLDRRVIGEDSILECKTTNEFNKKLWKDEEVPECYILQCMHYLAVTGYSKAYIACLIGGQKYIWKEIPRDEELIQIMIEKEREFWSCVEMQIPPKESKPCELFKKDDGTTIHLKLASELLEWDKLCHEEDEIKAQKNVCKEKIQAEMKEAQIALCDERKITWKTTVTNRIDTKRLKAEKPEIYEAYLKESSSRVFKIK